jgi:hypothetical protein
VGGSGSGVVGGGGDYDYDGINSTKKDGFFVVHC